MGLDQSLFVFIQQFTGNPLLDGLALFLAEYLAFLIPLSLIYLWFESRSSREDSVFVFITALMGIGFTYVMGLFYFHHQPFSAYDTIVAGEELNNAFPSQHTAAVFSCFWSFLYLRKEKFAALFGVAGVLTGFTRVFVGLHYPVDILGGITSGLVGLGFTILVCRYLSEYLDRLIDLTEFGFYLRDE